MTSGATIDRSIERSLVPYAIHVDRVRGRLTVIGTDPIGLPDVLALLSRQIESGAWGFGSLHDARLVTWQPTPADILTIVGFIDSNAETLGPRGPVAFLAHGEAVVGMAQMYAQVAEASALRAEVFRDVQAAEEWLDLAVSKDKQRRAAANKRLDA